MKPRTNISKNMVYRLPIYLTVTRQLLNDGHKFITAPQISDITNINVETVKKDLSIICETPGNPRLGREAKLLVDEISDFGVYTSVTKAVIIGTGSLGKALLSYRGFFEWGLEITAGFDVSPDIINTQVHDKKILPIEELPDYIKENNIEIAVITVPADSAQSAVDTAVKAGVKAIWNFAPKNISVPKNIFYQSENMASSLSMLNYHLKIHRSSKPSKKSKRKATK